MTKYFINRSNQVYTHGKEIIYIETFTNRMSLKGEGIIELYNQAIQCFENGATLEWALEQLVFNYNSVSAKRILDFFVDNKIILSENDELLLDGWYKTCSPNSVFYKVQYDSLAEEVNKLSDKKIGIIGNSIIAKELLSALTQSNILNNFDTYYVDENNPFGLEEYLEKIVLKSDFVIVALEEDYEEILNIVNHYCYKKEIPWLRLQIQGALCDVGPIFIPKQTACYSCLKIQTNRNMSMEEYIFSNNSLSKQNKHSVRYPIYPAARMGAAIAMSETIKYLITGNSIVRGNICSLNSINLNLTLHNVRKVYNCEVCLENR